jgi:hypothetical protein
MYPTAPDRQGVVARRDASGGDFGRGVGNRSLRLSPVNV